MGMIGERFRNLTRCGRVLYSIFFAAIVLAVFNGSMSGSSVPNGELEAWIQLDQCSNGATDINIMGRGYFRGFTLRPETDPVAQACASNPPMSAKNSISLESSDGWRLSAMYTPVLLLPTNSYMALSFEIKNAEGKVVVPTSNYFLGPDDAYPWTVTSSLLVGAPPPPAPWNGPPSPSPPPPASCTCLDTCTSSWTSDGICDDGGPGSQYGGCAFGTDCSDCGARCSGGATVSPPPSPQPSGVSCSNACTYPTDGVCDGVRLFPCVTPSHPRTSLPIHAPTLTSFFWASSCARSASDTQLSSCPLPRISAPGQTAGLVRSIPSATWAQTVTTAVIVRGGVSSTPPTAHEWMPVKTLITTLAHSLPLPQLDACSRVAAAAPAAAILRRAPPATRLHLIPPRPRIRPRADRLAGGPPHMVANSGARARLAK